MIAHKIPCIIPLKRMQDPWDHVYLSLAPHCAWLTTLYIWPLAICSCSTQHLLCYRPQPQVWLSCSHLDYGHTGADVYQQVREDVWVTSLKAELGVRVLGIHKGLMGDVPQHKVTSLDKTGHLVLFVHPNTVQNMRSPLAWVIVNQMWIITRLIALSSAKISYLRSLFS